MSTAEERLAERDSRKAPALAFIEVLAQKIREQIVVLLYENVEMSYTELLNALDIDEGLLNFHLRKMKDLVKVTEDRTYMLSERGKLAYSILKDVETRMSGENVELGLGGPALGLEIVFRRISAFLLDAVILFISTGLFLDRNLVSVLADVWSLRPPSLSLVELSYATISAYSHVFFAAFIIFTILEAYKGQTLGKYLTGIRVAKVNGRKVSLMDSAVRNLGKIFLLPLDIIIGILRFSQSGYLRFFDFYTGTTVEKVGRT